jgi:hypothetical protein
LPARFAAAGLLADLTVAGLSAGLAAVGLSVGLAVAGLSVGWAVAGLSAGLAVVGPSAALGASGLWAAAVPIAKIATRNGVIQRSIVGSESSEGGSEPLYAGMSVNERLAI